MKLTFYGEEKKNGLYHRLWVYLLIAIVPFIVVAAIITNGFIVGKSYRDFTTDLYQSIKDGTSANSIRAVYNGESTRITEDNAFNIASAIDLSRFKFYRKKFDAIDEMYLDFGNGDTMWLYKIDSETMIIKYIYANGDTKVFSTTEITRMVTFERMVSVEWGNEIWID